MSVVWNIQDTSYSLSLCTSNSFILLSSSDHISHPYRLLQYAWNSLVLTV